MKKYFCVSDIHSFGQILERDLQAAGFDKENKDHILIVLGDIFDRGNETKKVYEYLISIPEERRILIRGNHEYLYMKLLNKSFPDTIDFNNGTVRTFCNIADTPIEYLSSSYWLAEALLFNIEYERSYVFDQLTACWKDVREKVLKSEITKFILDDTKWVNYFELNSYAFVHSFVPVLKPETEIETDDNVSYDKDWRNATQDRWEKATWGCPWKRFKHGAFQEDKTLVVGHWHTSDFYLGLDGITEGKDECPIYNKDGLVGLDACTVLTDRINVLVIEE